MNEDWWNKYMRIPFVEKGRTEQGADCYGLGRLIYERELGIILPSYDDLYENTIHKSTVSKTINDVKAANFKTVETPKPFDFIILRFCGLPMHLGIVTNTNYMIHCSKDIGVAYEKYTGMRWKDKIIGFQRYEHEPNTGICNTETL